MRPLIGITSSMEIDGTSFTVSSDNVNAIKKAGGLPVILPNLVGDEVNLYAEKMDGLYLTGGYDIDPLYFAEEPHPNLGTVTPDRDVFEIRLINKMLELGKPILGVCRGCQILNVAVGGKMFQDIDAQIDQELLQHAQKAPTTHTSHYVNVLRDSLLYRLTEMEQLRVNSRHHQANRSVIDTFQVSGRANDGVIEAIENKRHPFVLGLQWHPENLAMKNDQSSLKIFQGFIEATRNQKGGIQNENH